MEPNDRKTAAQNVAEDGAASTLSMDINPYQAPRADTPADIMRQRLWLRPTLGVCCFGITLLLLALGFILTAHGAEHIETWSVIGTLAASSILMGAGMLARRDKLALGGWVLFSIPFAAAIVIRLLRSIGP